MSESPIQRKPDEWMPHPATLPPANDESSLAAPTGSTLTDKQRMDYLDSVAMPLDKDGVRLLFVAVGYIPKPGRKNPTTIREAVDLIVANEAVTKNFMEEFATNGSKSNNQAEARRT